MRKEIIPNAKQGFMIRKFTVVLLCAIILMMNVSALAIDPFNPSHKASLKLNWKAGEEIPVGTHFRIYRVAETNGFAIFTPVAPFDSYPVKMNDLDNTGWTQLASTLSGYADADHLQPTAEGDLDKNGSLKFDGLKTGLYLVTGSIFVGSEKTFTPEPVMISLPGRDANGEWFFDADVQMKYTSTDRDLTSRMVIKVWDDKNAEQYRPAEITVQLLRDNEVYEECKLSRDNNWRHEWTDLDTAYRWQVVEKTVPDGYTVRTSMNENTVTITNSRSSGGGGGGGGGSGTNLPQTGMLWWPVPVLAIMGMLFFLIGFIKNLGEEHE